MALPAGTRLGPYEVLSAIGAGGMGEVYRARDTRLNREVAVKVSKEQFSERFEREARAVAALNHPNICHLYDVGPNYLVMELVSGDGLAELARAPLPVETVVSYARQIAEALEAAHEKGIIHRDLKPANIKVTPEGTVKVLDFGLAKALEPDLPSPPTQNSLTMSLAMTEAGMILGTAGYMSPEQVKGRPADRRADIWAFGVVLYEMLVGKQAFTGETAAETLASVLKEPVDFNRLPQETPPALRHLLERCLQRDVRQRLQAIGEARIMLETPLQGSAAAATVPERTARPAGVARWIPWALSGVLLLALAGALASLRKAPAPQPIARFQVALPEGQVVTSQGTREVTISPDGTEMAYTANQQLYLRALSDLEARPIAGTESTVGTADPVFSPDGKSLAFWTGATDGSWLKRVPVGGGAAVTICPTGSIPAGLSWSEQGIVFAEVPKGIFRVPANGGQPVALVAGTNNELMESPEILPGGQAVLFTVAAGANPTSADWDKAQIVVQTLQSGKRKVLVSGGSDGRYLPSGHLVYAVRGVLFAVPFDARRLEITGAPVGIVEGVARATAGAAHFAFSQTGSLIYRPGPVRGSGGGQTVLALVDRKAQIEPLHVPAAGYGFPRVSRDGQRVAYQIDEAKESSIWVYELSGGAAPRRLTLPGTGVNRYPIWTADGQRVAFQSDREGDLGIWWQPADGSGAAERLTKPEGSVADEPDSWSSDGRNFSFTRRKNTTTGVWIYSLRDRNARVFADTPGASRSVFSPDGRWVAYQVTAQPNTRIYVRPFPPASATYAAPEDADSHHPVWSPDGKELFYVAGPSRLGSMSFGTQPSVRFGSPARAPRSGFATQIPAAARTYDILPDGKRFLGVAAAATAQPGQSGPRPFEVVLNWFEDVKQRAPGK